jgi:hypothetical protein
VNGTVGAAHDGTFVIEGIGVAEVNDEAGVFRATRKGNSRADFNAEGFVGLGIGKARGSGGVRALVTLDVDGAGRRGGAASVGRGANACGEAEQTSSLTCFLVSLPAINPVKRSGITNRQHRAAT